MRREKNLDMGTALKRGVKLTPSESSEWLKVRMEALNISGLEELHLKTGIDKEIGRASCRERV